MLEIVAKGFREAKNALTGHATLTESNIDSAVRQIRVSLLEADVELGVVKAFLGRVKERAIGEVVPLSVKHQSGKESRSPSEHFIYICHQELEALMGPAEIDPIRYRRPFTSILMVGLQGVGKTTTCGKLAQYFLKQKRKPMLVAADVYRPAAVQQLQTLAERLGVAVYAKEGVAPEQLCKDAQREAKKRKCDVLIYDSAGRLSIDETLMIELENIKALAKPDETFLVCDAMAGQNTVSTAAEFNRRLDLSGFIMTKLDGDARGGAALSIKEITGKPIKFLGMGEGLEQLEVFRPEGLASRILGMGDVVGLMKDFEELIDEKEAERDTKKLLRGEFTLDDFLKQLKMIQKLGPAKEIYERMPIFGDQLPEGVSIDNSMFSSMESMIQSMTKVERQDPGLIDDSRANRIARGSGRKPEQVKELVQRFSMMHQMMGQFAAQPGLLGKIPGFKQLAQLRKMKGQNMTDLFGGSAKGMPPGFPQMPPGLAGNPSAMMPPGMMPELPMGMGGYPGMVAAKPKQRSAKAKEKAKNKRKQARKARKRGRGK